MEKILTQALGGRGSFATRLKRGVKKIDVALAESLDVELACESRDAFAEWFEASVRPRLKANAGRTYIIILDDRLNISLGHAPRKAWGGKRAFLKGHVACPWAEALLDGRAKREAYRRAWILFLGLALQSCDPPAKQTWAVCVDELAQAYLGKLDTVEYEEDQ